MKHLEFYEIIKRQLEETFETQSEKIMAGAKVMANTLINDGLIHVFGSGHSQMFAQEMFYRAGGLVPVNALVIPQFSVYPVAKLSTALERQEGLVEIYLDMENTTAHDTMIIASVSGRNGAIVDMAMAAKKRNMTVIALTSIDFSSQITSRHSSGKKLMDVADIVIDLRCAVGDAALSIEGMDEKVVGTSTILGMTIVESMVGQTIQECIDRGFKPPVWMSSNTDEGDRYNASNFEKYKTRISNL